MSTQPGQPCRSQSEKPPTREVPVFFKKSSGVGHGGMP
jgi:hypothetical protein